MYLKLIKIENLNYYILKEIVTMIVIGYCHWLAIVKHYCLTN